MFYFTDTIPYDGHDDITTLRDRGKTFTMSLDLWTKRNHYRCDPDFDDDGNEYGSSRSSDDEDEKIKLGLDLDTVCWIG